MSVQTQIDRIEQNVANTYAVLEALGADIPAEQNSDNLARTAGSAKAVLYSEQSLSEVQKVQARTNIGLGNVDNVKQYSASNPPPYPVTSVNGQTGAVSLDASAVGAVPNTQTITVTGVDANGTTYTWTMYGVKQ